MFENKNMIVQQRIKVKEITHRNQDITIVNQWLPKSSKLTDTWQTIDTLKIAVFLQEKNEENEIFPKNSNFRFAA